MLFLLKYCVLLIKMGEKGWALGDNLTLIIANITINVTNFAIFARGMMEPYIIPSSPRNNFI